MNQDVQRAHKYEESPSDAVGTSNDQQIYGRGSQLVPNGEHLLTPKQVAAQLNVSERWVRDHATRRSPKITVIKLGPLLRFRQTDVDRFVDQQRTDHGVRRLRW